MPDALSRLRISETDAVKHKTNLKQVAYITKLNDELAYPVATLKISETWLQKLKQSYALDSRTASLIDQIKENYALGDNAADIPFEFENGILFAKSDALHNNKRPVVPKALEGDIFSYAHDQLGH